MVESEWKDRLRGLGLQAFPRTIVGAFYRVRFGEQPLTDANCIRLGMQLEQLERGLATGDSAAMPLETVPRPA